MKLKSLARRLMPRSIRTYRIMAGPLKGQHIVTSLHDYPAAVLGTTELPLLRWFKNNVTAGETWLDIGAHYGYTAIALSHLVGASGRVFAFEPHVRTAGYLTQTKSRNNLPQLTVIPFALGGPEDVEVVELPTIRGMVDRTIGATPWLERILVARMDWLWPRICGPNAQVHGVKIDVQGMEAEVLAGMGELLRRWRPKLVVEVHHGVDRQHLIQLIENAGYTTPGQPIDAIGGEREPGYLSDRSYAFC